VLRGRNRLQAMPRNKIGLGWVQVAAQARRPLAFCDGTPAAVEQGERHFDVVDHPKAAKEGAHLFKLDPLLQGIEVGWLG
jgi:hypothetical protein